MGDFARGFVFGAAASAAVVLVLTPHSGTETRQGIMARIKAAIETGKQAAATHEQKMWHEFHEKLKNGHKPKEQGIPDTHYPGLNPDAFRDKP